MITELDRQIFSEAFKLYSDFKERCAHPADFSPDAEKAWAELAPAYRDACDRCHMHPLAVEMMGGIIEGLSKWATLYAGKTDFKYNGRDGIL